LGRNPSGDNVFDDFSDLRTGNRYRLMKQAPGWEPVGLLKMETFIG